MPPVDRLTYKAILIDRGGDSYRLSEMRKTNGAIFDYVKEEQGK